MYKNNSDRPQLRSIREPNRRMHRSAQEPPHASLGSILIHQGVPSRPRRSHRPQAIPIVDSRWLDWSCMARAAPQPQCGGIPSISWSPSHPLASACLLSDLWPLAMRFYPPLFPCQPAPLHARCLHLLAAPWTMVAYSKDLKCKSISRRGHQVCNCCRESSTFVKSLVHAVKTLNHLKKSSIHNYLWIIICVLGRLFRSFISTLEIGSQFIQH
jgi:hypothetical protein